MCCPRPTEPGLGPQEELTFSGEGHHVSLQSDTCILNLPNAVTLNTVPHVGVTPNGKSLSLLLHNCNFDTVLDCNYPCFPMIWGHCDPQIENHCSRG